MINIVVCAKSSCGLNMMIYDFRNKLLHHGIEYNINKMYNGVDITVVDEKTPIVKIEFFVSNCGASKILGKRPDYFYCSDPDVKRYFGSAGSKEIEYFDPGLITLICKSMLNAKYGAKKHHDDLIDSLAYAYCRRDVELLKEKYQNDKSRHIKEENYTMIVKNVIFNDPATIVLWEDGTKTVVKCQKGEKFDPEKGLAIAICKGMLHNKGNFNNFFKKWIPKEESNEGES